MGWTGSWAVDYTDGTQAFEWQADHPEAKNGQVPFRAIDWPRVRTLRLESALATSQIEVPAAPEGLAWSLRRRWFTTMHGDSVGVFQLVLCAAGQEPTDATVPWSLFWVPDGSTHECNRFWSPEVADYAAGLLHGAREPLPVATHEVQVQADAAVIA